MADSDFPVPPDVPAYVPRTATWLANGLPTIGTPGTAPAYANELTDPNPIDLLTTGYLQRGGNYSGFEYKTQAQGATEAKFRTIINASHVLKADPIRAYGLNGAGHWHIFLGNPTTCATSTYASLRASTFSTNSGGPLNNTPYWIPAPLIVQGGLTYTKMPNYAVVYYVTGMTAALNHNLSRLPRGLRYVAGWNMDDHHEAAVAAELNAAGGYATPGNGFVGWKMANNDNSNTLIPLANGDNYSPCLKNLDGSDPWGGAAGPGTIAVATINAPDYWDGQNLWSPGGYKHFRHGVRHINSGQNVGPDGWFKVPTLEITFFWTHGGFSDYGTWRLSSDDHLQTIDPSHPTLANCSTFHADWFGAWDAVTFNRWQQNGMGVDNSVPHEMNDSVISGTERLILGEAAPNGRFPQVERAARYASVPAQMILLPTGSQRGPITLRQKAG